MACITLYQQDVWTVDRLIIERNKLIAVEERARRECDRVQRLDLGKFVPNVRWHLAIEPLGAQPASQED